MDSVEVAVKITEAIMARSSSGRTSKGENIAETYVDMFAEVLERVNVVMNPSPGMPPPPPLPRATSLVFPLSYQE